MKEEFSYFNIDAEELKEMEVDTLQTIIKNYFINKILKLEFEVTGINDHILFITINDSYNFHLWIGNPLIPTSVKPKHEYYPSFMQLEFTDEQAKELHSKIWPIVDEAKKKYILPERLVLFNKLKEELGL